jgi:hypothetical protein
MATPKEIPQGLIIDGIAASEAIDSSGEILDISGADITDLEEGRGVLNFEHKSEKDDGASYNDVLGRIIFAKKIFKEADCSNEREKKYWREVKLPLIYIQAELFDAEDHEGAKATAAMIRHYQRRGLPILVRYSIEGGTLKKEGNVIKRSIIKRVACTIKPCNKSCHSGVLSDPKDTLVDTQKTEVEFVPQLRNSDIEFYQRGHEVECDPIIKMEELDPRLKAFIKLHVIKKALTAGSYAGAPSTLTGGSALQVEDRRLHRLKNQALAAARDYNKSEHGDFRAFLKHRLPEADPTFIEMFSDLVDDYKVKKAEAEQALEKALASPKKERSEVVKAPAVVGLKSPKDMLTALPPDEPWFHAETGTLNVPRSRSHPGGRFTAYQPDASFDQAMEHPNVQDAHKTAMAHWKQLNELMGKRQLPPNIPMLTAILGGFSANEGVPVQELAMAHVMDMLNQGFNPAAGPLSPDQTKQLEAKWIGRQYPQYMAQTMAGREDIHALNPEKPDSFGLPRIVGSREGKIQALNSYHKMHGKLQELIQKHGNDGRAIVRELASEKAQYDKWKMSKEGRSGKAEYPGLSFDGIGSKILRYMVGMMGAGNVHVPDTHFIRHYFGLSGNGPSDPDNKAIKDVLWDPRNAEVLEGIDKHYFANHPAVKKVQKDYFKGIPTEQSIYPAFWLHWLGIPFDERNRGVGSNKNQNAGTDHAIYFNAANEVLRKYGIRPDRDVVWKSEGALAGIRHIPLMYRAAYATEHMRQKFGEGPATYFFHTFVTPAILAESHREAQKSQLVQKMESLVLHMRTLAPLHKGESQSEVAQAPEDIGRVPFNGKIVKPGEILGMGTKIRGRRFRIMDESPDMYVAVPHEVGADWKHEHLTLFDKRKANTHFKVTRPLETESELKLDSSMHGIPQYVSTKEQHDLIHGLDLAAKPLQRQLGLDNLNREVSGLNGEYSEWRHAGNGKVAFVKGMHPEWGNGWRRQLHDESP